MVSMTLRICFVCLGNICRSPTAEGIMWGLVEEAGLQGRVEVDSAGTNAFSVGGPPDSPVAIVPKVWHSASNKGMSPTIKSRTSQNVNTK